MATEDSFTDRLSEFLDGELDAHEHASVERHLASCAECRTTLADLRTVVARARRLEDTAPTTDLWPGILPRLEPRSAMGGILRPFRERARRRVSFTLPQLAAASLALMVLSGGMVWMARMGDPRADFPPVSADAAFPKQVRATPANFTDAGYDQAVSDLERLLTEGRTTLDPETIRILEDNLRTIDQAIDQARRALADDPANIYLNSHMARARQRKLALLRQASGFATTGS
jgi:hypothetical protein